MQITHAMIIGWILQYKYALLFPLMVIEGPIVTVLGAFLSAQGPLNVFIVYALSVTGDLVGDVFFYSVGRWGRGTLVRWGPYIGVSLQRIEQLETHFRGHGGKTLVIAKLTHAPGMATLIAAGTAQMPIVSFLFFNFVASTVKSLIFTLIGFYFGQFYKQIDQYITDYALIALGCIAVALAIFLIRRHSARKKILHS